jgi:flagellar motility protein MotE (MotC chaperone)
MEQGIDINVVLPLWGVVSMSVTCLGAFAWVIIKLYFSNQTMVVTGVRQDNELTIIAKRLERIKEANQKAIDEHKKDTDEKFTRLNTKLDKQNDTLVEVKTMVGLLVSNKIKD